MKIAYDHQVFSIQRHGGVSRYFAELIGELQPEPDVHTSVIAPFHINEYLQRPQIRRHVSGWCLPPFRGGPRVVAALNAAVLPLAWAARRFDIIHETYYSRVSRGRCGARILTIYDMIHELFAAEIPEAAAVTAAKRAAVARADHVICISETTRQDAIRLLGLEPARSSVVYLGCSLDPSNDSAAAPIASSGKPYVLYVGKREGYKNFAQLVRSFMASTILRQEFELVAFGGGGFAPEERQLLEGLDAGNRVRQVSGDDGLLAAFYRGAAAFAYPSRYEGFGIPPLEAMANDCPVVCSNAGSIEEVVGDAGAYFDPTDGAQLSAQLERVVTDAARANELRRLGREQIAKYSWKKCAAETLAVYRRAAGSAN